MPAVEELPSGQPTGHGRGPQPHRRHARRVRKIDFNARHVHACEVCGRRFTGVRADARYFSTACRQTAYRQRKGNDHD
jgi:hypothetical protein